jgi:hypothetical protein
MPHLLSLAVITVCTWIPSTIHNISVGSHLSQALEFFALTEVELPVMIIWDNTDDSMPRRYRLPDGSPITKESMAGGLMLTAPNVVSVEYSWVDGSKCVVSVVLVG